jgi:polysaccharide pyruvyl transferase WcaK-like protein
VALLRTIGVDRHIERGADLAFLLPAPKPDRGEALFSAAGASGTRPRIGVAFRRWPGLPAPEAFGRAVRTGSNGTIIALPFDRARDGEVSRRVAAGGGGVTIDPSTPHDLLAVVAAMDAIVAVRLHALIFAVCCGLPALAIAYDPKVRAFAEEIGAPCLPATASVDSIARECAAMVPDASARRARSAAALERLKDLANRGLDELRPWADTP